MTLYLKCRTYHKGISWNNNNIHRMKLQLTLNIIFTWIRITQRDRKKKKKRTLNILSIQICIPFRRRYKNHKYVQKDTGKQIKIMYGLSMQRYYFNIEYKRYLTCYSALWHKKIISLTLLVSQFECFSY